MSLIDLTGRRFGRLVVTSRAGSSASGNATWWADCDCGKITQPCGTDLRLGRTVSCGCSSKDKIRSHHAGRRESMLGRTFGRLTVIAFAGLNSYPRATWLCRCTCGTEKVTTQHHLVEGSVVSCGCRAADPRPGGRRERPGYQAAHGRVKFEHGPASAHTCVDCAGPASDWSYDHECPNELTDPRGRPYSTTVSHYQPRCSSCHRRFDHRMATVKRNHQHEECTP